MARKPEAREWATTIDKAKIDAEPTKQRVQYRNGQQAWFVNDGRWFLVEIVSNDRFRMTIKPVTGRDAERQVDWPYGAALDFRLPRNRRKDAGLGLYDRLRPLSARRA